MRKTLLLLLAFVASIGGAWAQEPVNLALGATVTEIYTPSGKEAPSAADLAKITDGNTGTNVLLPNVENDIAAISIDLGETNATTKIGSFAVVQDGRHATAYKIYGTNTAPATYSTSEELATAKASWTELASATNDNNAGGDNNIYTKLYAATANSGFRYIVFVPTAQAWGVSLRQIKVNEYETPVLTTFSISAVSPAIITGGTTATTVTKLDQIGVDFDGVVTYSSDNTSVADVSETGVVTGKTAGSAKITATLGGKTADVTIIVVAAPSDIPALATTGDITKIYTGEESASGYDWADWAAATKGEPITVNGKGAFMMSNFTYYGSQFAKMDASGATKLHLDVYALNEGKLTIVPICWNSETSVNEVEKGTEFTLTAGAWNSLDIAIDKIIDD